MAKKTTSDDRRQYEIMLSALYEIANNNQCHEMGQFRSLAKKALNMIGNPTPMSRWTLVDIPEPPKYNLIVKSTIRQGLYNGINLITDRYLYELDEPGNRARCKEDILRLVYRYVERGDIYGTPAVDFAQKNGKVFVSLYSSTPTSSPGDGALIYISTGMDGVLVKESETW